MSPIRSLVLILSLLFAASALADTVTLQQGLTGYTGSADAYILNSSPNTPLGGQTWLNIGQESAVAIIARFAIFQSEGGPVPDGSTISSATLSLYKHAGTDGVFKASRALKNWNETQVTWNTAASGTPWTLAGANSSGSDYLATPDGQGTGVDAQSTGCDGSAGQPQEICWLNIDVTSGVQAFAANPGSNFGWKIAQVSSSNPMQSKTFHSRENGAWPALRPKLAITYSPPPCTLPQANFTWSETPAGSRNVTFNASASSNGTSPITSLRLQFGDNEEVVWNDKNQQQSHQYAAPLTYTARLTATSACGTSPEYAQDVVLDPVADIPPDTTNPAGVLGSAVPTFHSMGLYYKPASDPSNGKVWMRYRKATETNSEWREGYPLWFDPRTTGNALPHAFRARGSAVHLQPGTRYYFEFGTGASFASATWHHHVAGTTWSETFPQDPNVVTIPSQSAPYVITTGGNAGAYKVYDGWNGSSKNIIDRAGATSGNPIWLEFNNPANTPDTSFALVIKASFVIVRRVVVRGAALANIYIHPNVTDVVIEDTEISDWDWRLGKTSANEPNNPNGWGTWGDTEAGGIHLSGNNSRIVVQRNVIKDPHFGSFPWDTDVACGTNNHPIGPNGVTVWKGAQQNVIRYNEISGKIDDDERWLMDGIGGGENFSATGSPGADSDIYQNIILRVFDDAIEAEGGGRNVRVWGNYTSEVKSMVALSTVHFGPTYVWRNVSNKQRTCYAHGATDADPDAFKVAGKKSDYGNGIRYLFHNTLLQNPAAPGGAGYGVEAEGNGDLSAQFTFARNNIFHVRTSSDFSVWAGGFGPAPAGPPPGADFLVNLYNGQWSPGTLPAPGTLYFFTTSQLTYQPGHGWSSVPGLVGEPNPGTGNYQLADTSAKGRKVGEPLPNFTKDVYDTQSAGQAGYKAVSGTCNNPSEPGCPDVGAHQFGAGAMKFGVTAGQ